MRKNQTHLNRASRALVKASKTTGEELSYNQALQRLRAAETLPELTQAALLAFLVSSTKVSEYPIGDVWSTWDSDFIGIEASKKASHLEVINAAMRVIHGIDISELSVEHVSRLEDAVEFIEMRPITAEDFEAGRGSLDGDVGEWHTEGSGEGSRPTWWLDKMVAEIVAEEHEETHPEVASEWLAKARAEYDADPEL